MAEERKERVLWLGYNFALAGKWLTYDKQSKQFGVTSVPERDLFRIYILKTLF